MRHQEGLVHHSLLTVADIPAFLFLPEIRLHGPANVAGAFRVAALLGAASDPK
jgi:hypothetical protein